MKWNEGFTVKDVNGDVYELTNENIRAAARRKETKILACGSIGVEIQVSEETLTRIAEEYRVRLQEFVKFRDAAREEEEREKVVRREALSKLTAEEKKALGL